jgi:ubiquinone/menaquinone biosynthesis C-methylase UbiE
VPSPSLTALAAAALRLRERPERVLEIGCGEGEGVLFLAREFPSARVRGVDPAEETIRAVVARTGLDPEGRVAFKAATPRRLPYPDDFFDLVAQRGGRLRLNEIARVLRPGGRLIVVGGWRLLDWRLRGRGFDSLEPGEAAGERFLIARLAPGPQAPE